MKRAALYLIYVFFTTGGLFCFKKGGALTCSLKDGLSLDMSWTTAIGFVLFCCSFLLWQHLVATTDISYLFPVVTGIVQVVVLLMAVFYFHENVSMKSLLGIFFILTGIFLVSR